MYEELCGKPLTLLRMPMSEYVVEREPMRLQPALLFHKLKHPARFAWVANNSAKLLAHDAWRSRGQRCDPPGAVFARRQPPDRCFARGGPARAAASWVRHGCRIQVGSDTRVGSKLGVHVRAASTWVRHACRILVGSDTRVGCNWGVREIFKKTCGFCFNMYIISPISPIFLFGGGTGGMYCYPKGFAPCRRPPD